MTSPPGHDNEPSIALDADGSVWIAFTRWAPEDPDACAGVIDCVVPPEGVYYVTNKAGQWSEPRSLAPPHSNAPSLEMRNGAIHLGYAAGSLCGELCGGSMTHYRTNATGSWADVELGETLGPSELEIGSDGSAYLVDWTLVCDDVSSVCRPVVEFSVVDGTTGAVTRETAWEGDRTDDWVYQTLLGLDDSDTPHLVAVVDAIDAGEAAHYLTKDAQGWAEREAPPRAEVRAGAVDATGSLHLLACCAVYLTNSSGAYEEIELMSGDGMGDTAADIAVDQQARSHTLFVTSGNDGTTLWYAVGPA